MLSTGGTIAGSGSSSTDLSNYKPGAILGEQLVKAVPQIAQIADVRVEQIVNVSSSDITIDNWLTLAKRIQAILKETPAVSGFVITSGTNTLEETAYFLNLTVSPTSRSSWSARCGRRRPSAPTGRSTCSTPCARRSRPNAKGKGALIVLNDEINAARDTTKTNTLRVETFRAPELGLLGYVDEDKVSFYRSTTKRHTANTEFDVTSSDDAAEGVDPVFLHRAGCVADPGGDQGRREGHRVRGHRQRHALGLRGNVAQGNRRDAGGIRPALVRSSRVGNGRVIATAEYDALGHGSRRHAESAEGAHPADAGADEDQRSQRAAQDLLGVLSHETRARAR